MPDFVRIYPNVSLPPDAELDDFVILGRAPRGAQPGELPLIFGPGCVIRAQSVIYAGNTIGARFQTGHGVMIREANTIGDDVSVGTGSIVEHHVTIGNGVRLHSHVFVPEYSVLEDGCWLGPGVIVTNARYPRSRDVKANLRGPIDPGWGDRRGGGGAAARRDDWRAGLDRRGGRGHAGRATRRGRGRQPGPDDQPYR